jgi:hypothetical protein
MQPKHYGINRRLRLKYVEKWYNLSYDAQELVVLDQVLVNSHY